MVDVKRELARLSLEVGEEEEAVSLGALTVVGSEFVQNYFVGSFLTSSVIHFASMRATLANIWHPIGGITITDMTDGRYLFRLYHRAYANRLKQRGLGTLILTY